MTGTTSSSPQFHPDAVLAEHQNEHAYDTSEHDEDGDAHYNQCWHDPERRTNTKSCANKHEE
jgi:hypothetical protein